MFVSLWMGEPTKASGYVYHISNCTGAVRVNRLVQRLIQTIKGSNNQTKGARFAISLLQNVSRVVGLLPGPEWVSRWAFCNERVATTIEGSRMIAASCKGRSSSGPRLCRTPVRSPQSDRIGGASAQMLKGDYALRSVAPDCRDRGRAVAELA
jgi:hypothetical protein